MHNVLSKKEKMDIFTDMETGKKLYEQRINNCNSERTRERLKQKDVLELQSPEEYLNISSTNLDKTEKVEEPSLDDFKSGIRNFMRDLRTAKNILDDESYPNIADSIGKTQRDITSKGYYNRLGC